LVKGFNRVVGSVFEVTAQVDLGLTTVGRFDSADLAISANDANEKPGASQQHRHRPRPRMDRPSLHLANQEDLEAAIMPQTW
jgi:hypothetical protein